MKYVILLICFLNFYLGIAQINTQRLDSLVNELEQKNVLWGSFVVQKGDEVLYERSIGYQDVENKIENTSSTLFKIGSITKTFTSVIFLNLMEEGKITLDQKLSDFYPDIPNAEYITMRMLLQHRSGLANYTSEEGFLKRMVNPISNSELLEEFSNAETDFFPNQKYEYSNTNYMLLTFILEKISGKSYQTLFIKYIKDKINLDNTFYLDCKQTLNSYLLENQPFIKATVWDMSWAQGAGAMISNSKDLVQFYKALFEGELISKSSLEKMTTLQSNYGLGVVTFPFNKNQGFGHTGGIENFHSMAGYFPNGKVTFAIILNGTSDNNFSMNDLAIALLSMAYGKEIEMPTFDEEVHEIAVDKLEKYTGTYTAKAFPMDIKIFVQNGILYGQATGQPAFPLKAKSDTRFAFNPANIKIEFYTEEGSQKFHFHQGGYSNNFVRK